MSKYTGEILMLDVSNSIRTVELEHDPLNTDFKILTRKFLNFFIEDDCLNLSFQYLRNKYLERFDAKDSEFFNVPENENDFYSEICKTYFSLIPNNSKNLEEKVNSIVEDIRKIEQDKSN